MSRGGVRPNSGRPKGAMNEANRAAKELMKSYSWDAAKIIKAMTDDLTIDPHIRLKACTWIWEQAYGRARQAIVHEDEEGNVVPPPAQINIIGENHLKEIIARTSEEVANQESEENNNV